MKDFFMNALGVAVGIVIGLFLYNMLKPKTTPAS